MKRRIIGTIVLAGLAIGGIALFYGIGGQNTEQQNINANVAAVQDERLSIGTADAPVKIVEYVDMLCPYCARAHTEIVPRIKNEYIDTNKAHYEIRLVAVISPDSQRAAEGAYCAAEQNKFWPYIDAGYEETWQKFYSKDKDASEVDTFSRANIGRLAENAGLDRYEFEACIDSGKYIETLNENKAQMTEMKAYGTPHFLFNGQSYNGAPPYTFFQKAIDAEYEKAINS